MLCAGLIVDGGAVGQNCAAPDQLLLEIGAVKTGIAGAVQLNPAKFRTLAGRFGVRIAESNLGISQGGVRLAGFAVVTLKEEQAMKARALNQQLALPFLPRR